MQSLLSRSAQLPRGISLRRTSAKTAGASKPLICRVNTEADVQTTEKKVEVPTTDQKVRAPEWVPEPIVPALNFLNAQDFKLQESNFYKQYLAKYAENDWVVQSTGFKPIPESINGRAAMLGFVAAAGAEIFGYGPVIGQLSFSPQPVLVILALVTAASIIPIAKGAQGNYLDSLKDTYSLPEGVFTEANERVHGRLAMVGLGSMIFLELVLGHAVL